MQWLKSTFLIGIPNYERRSQLCVFGLVQRSANPGPRAKFGTFFSGPHSHVNNEELAQMSYIIVNERSWRVSFVLIN